MSRQSLLTLVFCCLGLAAISGCFNASRQKNETDASRVSNSEVVSYLKSAPAWVNRGTGLQVNSDGRFFYGVGNAVPMGDMALQKATSDDAARRETERIFAVYVDELLSAYLVQAQANLLDVDKKQLKIQSDGLKKLVFPSMRIFTGWREINSGKVWSMAGLEMKSVKTTITQHNGLDEGFKHFIAISADDVFDQVMNKGDK